MNNYDNPQDFFCLSIKVRISKLKTCVPRTTVCPVSIFAPAKFVKVSFQLGHELCQTQLQSCCWPTSRSLETIFNSDSLPPMEESDDDTVQETWETGLRQRRRQRQRGQSSSNNDIDDGDDNCNGDESPLPRRESNENNSNSRMTNGSHTGGAVVGGLPCHGNGAAAVAVGMQSGQAIGGGAPQQHQFTTPFKAPMKDSDGGAGLLVAATPSSITTAGETAESTYLSQSPIIIRRRRGSTGPNRPPSNNAAPSLNRQYQLLRSQIIILLGTSTLGLILFLFYALPLLAFLSLLLMVSSMGALLPVAISFVRARYELEMEHPLGLVRYLPDSLRTFLTETTLHEFMADTTFFMETRYLLMYFLPGLSPEQLMEYIHRLPPRHRDALLQPGLGRLIPSVMENLMRMDDTNNFREQYDLDNPDTLMVGTNDDDASSASLLTIERDRRGGNGGDAEVTFLEAATSLRRTLSSFASRQSNATNTNVALPYRRGESRRDGDDAGRRPLPPIASGTSHNDESRVDNQEDGDENSSFDFSVDLSAHEPTNILTRRGNDETPIMPAVAVASTSISDLRNVIVELPQPSTLYSNDVDTLLLQQEYDLEGRILSEAATAAVANYTGQASVAARIAASDVIASSSSWLIRAGVFTGLIAGGGGIAATLLLNRQVDGPSINSNLTRSPLDDAGGVNSITSDSTSERRNGYSLTLYGLFATSALGFVGAGIAYIARNRARAIIAASRQDKCLENAPKEKNEKHDP